MEDILNNPETIKEIMEEIHRNKLESAERWKEIQSQLAEDIVKKQEEILQAEKEQTIKDFYDSQLIDIFSQFESLQNSNSKDLQAYITANPGRRQLFEEMQAKAREYHGKRKTPPQKIQLPPITFEDQIQELMQHLAETIDISSLTLFADRAFIYNGEIYTHGAKILLITRAGEGHEMPATIYNITEFELTVYFEDKGSLTIPAEDIISGKVKFMQQKIPN